MGIFDRFGFGQPKAATEIQETRYRGASRMVRSMASWVARLGSPTSDLPANEQRTLRARSRAAFRDQLLARAALTRCRTNIVGTGLMCRPAVDAVALGMTEEAADELNTQLASAFAMWAEDPLQCDWEATLDFYGLQGLGLLSAMLSGDVFGLTPDQWRPGGTAELKVQLIEADRVSNPNDASDSPEMVDGVRFESGVPVGCWIRSTHPGDALPTTATTTWNYYPFIGAETGRRRVLQVWNDKERPGQVRGAPYLAPILEPLMQLQRYGSAELMAAVVSAMFTVFIEKTAEQLDAEGNPVPALPESEAATSTTPAQIALGNGAIVDLAPGEKASSMDPSRPNANFDPFFVAVVKQIGAALELPLDELLLHYSSSYSAARAAMLQAWRFYTSRRWMLVQQFCQPIYGLWMDEQVAAGRLALAGYADPVRRRAYSRALWIGPSRGAMDEEKEARAAKTRIEIGVSNETIETAAMTGEDWSTVNAQRAREVAIKKANGTWVDPKPVAVVPEPKPEPEEQEEKPPAPAIGALTVNVTAHLPANNTEVTFPENAITLQVEQQPVTVNVAPAKVSVPVDVHPAAAPAVHVVLPQHPSRTTFLHDEEGNITETVTTHG